ncbi:MAG: EbhA [Adlercreutzia mucosicola]|nr:EbhA [Adlercreutzia mucosicola]
MRKKAAMLLGLALAASVATGCSAEELYAEVSAEVEAYNAAVATYNEQVARYNEAVDSVKEENKLVVTELGNAQKVVNSDGEPYDGATLLDLKNAMAELESAKVDDPVSLKEESAIEVNAEMSRDELEQVEEDAMERSAQLDGKAIPDPPLMPDYTDAIEGLRNALQLYQMSVQSLNQITAPADEFVIERLQGVDTITKIEAVTEEHDPNGQLNKQGGYIGCVYFRDSQIGADSLYLEDGEEDVIEIGTAGGGAIEIFQAPEEAEARNQYLAGFDGAGFLSPGSHQVEGTLVVRTSDNLTATQQNELTEKIVAALIDVR